MWKKRTHIVGSRLYTLSIFRYIWTALSILEFYFKDKYTHMIKKLIFFFIIRPFGSKKASYKNLGCGCPSSGNWYPSSTNPCNYVYEVPQMFEYFCKKYLIESTCFFFTKLLTVRIVIGVQWSSELLFAAHRAPNHRLPIQEHRLLSQIDRVASNLDSSLTISSDLPTKWKQDWFNFGSLLLLD